MKLAVKHRVGEKKKDIKDIRREGNIPAIIYFSKGQPEKLIVSGAEFSAVLRQMKMGQLPTTIFTLSDGKKERRAVIKDIQYHLTTYIVSHIDFEELVEDVPVSVKVPVNCIGVVDCMGIKLGGFLRQVVRHVKVECLPKHIPSEFIVDVKDLGIRQSKRLKDVAVPAGVRLLASPEEVLVVIAKR
jgi:large subunit ribosomal protein L25